MSDSPFFPDPTSCTPYLVLHPQGTTFLAWDENDKKLAHVSTFLGRPEDPAYQYLQNPNPLESLAPWANLSKLQVFIASPKTFLIPDHIAHNPQITSRVYGLNYDYTPGEYIFNTKVKGTDMWIGAGVPTWVARLAKSWSSTLAHPLASWLSVQHANIGNTWEMYLHLDQVSGLWVSLWKEGVLQICNRYPAPHPNDALYYCVLARNAAGGGNAHLAITLTGGNPQFRESLFQLLGRYIKSELKTPILVRGEVNPDIPERALSSIGMELGILQ